MKGYFNRPGLWDIKHLKYKPFKDETITKIEI